MDRQEHYRPSEIELQETPNPHLELLGFTEERSPLTHALDASKAWQKLDKQDKKNALHIDTEYPRYGTLFDGTQWEFRGQTTRTYNLSDKYPVALIEGQEFRYDRDRIINRVAEASELMSDNGSIFVTTRKEHTQDALEPDEMSRYKRILKDNGFTDPEIEEIGNFVVWSARKKPHEEEAEDLELYQIPPVLRDLFTNTDLLDQLPNGEFLAYTTESPEKGVVYKRTGKAIQVTGTFNYLDEEKKKKFAAIFVIAPSGSSPNITHEQYSRLANRLRRQNPKKNDYGEIIEGEKSGGLLIVHERAGRPDSDIEKMELKGTGLVSSNIRIGRKDGDPVTIQARRRKEAKRAPVDHIAAGERNSKDPEKGFYNYSKEWLIRGDAGLKRGNPDVKSIDNSKIVERLRSSTNFELDRYDAENGLDRTVEYWCGCKWDIPSNATPEYLEHCGNSDCEHKSPPEHAAAFYSSKEQEEDTKTESIGFLVNSQMLEGAHCTECGSDIIKDQYVGDYDENIKGVYKLTTEYICNDPSAPHKNGTQTAPVSEEGLLELFGSEVSEFTLERRRKLAHHEETEETENKSTSQQKNKSEFTIGTQVLDEECFCGRHLISSQYQEKKDFGYWNFREVKCSSHGLRGEREYLGFQKKPAPLIESQE